MISMLISGTPETERKELLACARDRAAVLTDDNWTWIECTSPGEVQAHLSGENNLDIVCLDLSVKGNLEAAAGFRAAFSACYIVLIADATLSPVRYMRPAISAQSLMIKPLTGPMMKETLGEVISSYVRITSEAGQEKTFLLEGRDIRQIFPYQRIWFFESREKKVFLNTDTEDFGFYASLDQLETRLGEDFIRVHRSFLINRSKIESVRLSVNEIVMTGGFRIPLSRSCKPRIRAFLEEQK